MGDGSRCGGEFLLDAIMQGETILKRDQID
jgi:hypothetical protein